MTLAFFTIPLAFACVIRLVNGLKEPQPDLFTESLLFVGAAGWSCAIWLLINIVV
jgi:hypothetical protein